MVSHSTEVQRNFIAKEMGDATLPPGNYTAQVSGANGSTGVALVEIYELR